MWKTELSHIAGMAVVHVTPLNDLFPHVDDSECDCHPKVQYQANKTDNSIGNSTVHLDSSSSLVPIFVHNSFDKRELVEQKTSQKKINYTTTYI